MGLRDKRLASSLEKAIADLCKGLSCLKIMHVCGTHEYTISRFGLRSLLPDNLEVISGPGCPVCCTPASDIDILVDLSLKKNVCVTCFGDMLRVPGSTMSLAAAKARGGKTKIVYSILEAVEFAKKNKDLEVVHSAIGFETTAPTTAAVLTNSAPSNFSILSSHRIIPPAMDFLLSQDDNRIDGFIAPGHVSVVIGANAYKPVAKKYNRPVVVAGFEPTDILYSIYLIACQIKRKEAKVENEYIRAVDWGAQKKAVRLIKKTFDVENSFWRGLGEIPGSGLVLKKSLSRFDCLHKFKLKKEKNESIGFKNCRCADVLKGKIYPNQCPAFGRACIPEHPLGPCMVSYEGSCAIFYSYRNNEKLRQSEKRSLMFKILFCFLICFCLVSPGYAAPCYGTKMPQKKEIFIGLETYSALNRKLEKEYGKIRSLQNFFLLSYGILDWLSLDLKGGAGNLKHRPETGSGIDYLTYLGGGYGFRARLYQKEKTKIVFGFQHISIHPHTVSVGVSKYKAVLDDWQFSLLLSHDFLRITPYIGTRWSRMDNINWIDTIRNREKSSLGKSMGLIIGADFPISKKAWINIEEQSLDATAIAGSLNFAF